MRNSSASLHAERSITIDYLFDYDGDIHLIAVADTYWHKAGFLVLRCAVLLMNAFRQAVLITVVP